MIEYKLSKAQRPSAGNVDIRRNKMQLMRARTAPDPHSKKRLMVPGSCLSG